VRQAGGRCPDRQPGGDLRGLPRRGTSFARASLELLAAHPELHCHTRDPEALVDGLLEVNALFRLRAAQGVLGLADKHGVGPARLEAACAKALEVGDPSYRTVKGILAAHAETQPAPPATGDGGAAAHLHGPLQLFATVIPLPTSDPTLEVDPATTTATASAKRDGHGDGERHRLGDQGQA